jgi:hypothetical protein
MKRMIGMLAVAVLANACSEQQKAPTAPPYYVDRSVKEIMAHVIDPASALFWRSSGTVVTAQGEQDLSPTTNEGWEAAESAAITTAEAGNLLMLPGRALDNGEWVKWSRQLIEEANAGALAAEHHDKKAMFETGGRIYQVCTACHQKYMPSIK